MNDADMQEFLSAAIRNLTNKNIRIRIQDDSVYLIHKDQYYTDNLEAFLYPGTWEIVGRWLDAVA